MLNFFLLKNIKKICYKIEGIGSIMFEGKMFRLLLI